ncbi:pyruvate kinase [bacterium]|nr:pyruvate kinase [bacterium]MCI0615535.1 pyruvate kinase [bacterium]
MQFEKPALLSVSSARNEQILHLIDELQTITNRMWDLVAKLQNDIEYVHPSYRKSAENLVHYLALRQEDIRSVQEQLAELGLSSLGRAESHVQSSVTKVLEILRHLSGQPAENGGEIPRHYLSYMEGKSLLTQHTVDMLGLVPSGRSVRIMVTMPSEAAEDYQLVKELLLRGMDCMRINCAHDHPDAWSRMISNVRRAEKNLGKKCLVLMDLSGPKLRTGSLIPGPSILKISVKRDKFGNRKEPARIWLTPQEDSQSPPVTSAATLFVSGNWLEQTRIGDEVEFTDLRGKLHRIQIIAEVGKNRFADLLKTTFINPGIKLKLISKKKANIETTIVSVPPIENPILLSKGDTLILFRESLPGSPATIDARGRLLSPAKISCTLPEIFSQLRKGESVWFDDGKIGGIIQSVSDSEIAVKVTHADEGGSKLRSDKGINFPDSELKLPALTTKDMEDLDFVAANADMVGLSFAQNTEDIFELQRQLKERHAENVGLIIKIETRRGFEQLPKLILAGMRTYPLGVMIARGDLAVECGYERLAEIQEEILWICEAAHIPAIWATQVLETLSKKGIPSRAEITDAAMSVRAECVMLNKGPYITTAVATLDDILQRMQGHQDKKTSRLRRLSLSKV